MNEYINPRLVLVSREVKPGQAAWRSPSNLAIIKYWGKYGNQLPRNPSLSFTLDEAYTDMTVWYQAKSTPGEGIHLDFRFENKPNEVFQAKMVRFLESILDIFPFLKQLDLSITSSNSFPHSSGIASSASSMSALALCLCSLERQLFGNLERQSEFLKKASFIARLASGSACRSVYPLAAVWGKSGEVAESSDLYAAPFSEGLHEVFRSYHDDILIISRGEKSVSSRAGHGLMEGNIYADNRYAQARQRFHLLLNALRTGDVDAFGQIAEAEALTLHALMMSSHPPYILMQPNTIAAIQKVQRFRQENNLPLYFSLDAGPNLHLLYPEEIAGKIRPFISEELAPLCEEGKVIEDGVGRGPVEGRG